MRPFDELIAEAKDADVNGWGFDWLNGRASEERPPWGYAARLTERLAVVDSALDIDTGGGEVVDEALRLPKRMVATEAFPPNFARARQRLGLRGVQVVESSFGLDDKSFDLVTSRHPVNPNWPEIHRVLKPGGCYFAQHVGPGSAFELIELFLGPLDKQRNARDPEREVVDARSAGLTLVDLQTARCRMEFYDIGAVVWILRKCVWWVPNFSVDVYQYQLRELDARLRAGQPFVAYSTRHLIEVRRQS